jgi:hypothetical protein
MQDKKCTVKKVILAYMCRMSTLLPTTNFYLTDHAFLQAAI